MFLAISKQFWRVVMLIRIYNFCKTLQKFMEQFMEHNKLKIKNLYMKLFFHKNIM